MLVVEDDAKTAALIRMYLERDGYPVLVASNGRDAIELARRKPFGIIILDLMLPEIDGFDVVRILRGESDVPIVMVTARTAESDTLLALDLGADDYVTKPFRPSELVARVRTILRRRSSEQERPEELLRFGDLEIDARRHEVRVRGSDAGATRRELQLLLTLAREPGRAFTRLQLVDQAFGILYEGLERTVDSHMRNLRRKIEDNPDAPRYIETVYGVGYRFVENAHVP